MAGQFLETNLSLASSCSDVTHTSRAGSPLKWKVHCIVSPVTGNTLRPDRWSFNVTASGTQHKGKVTLGPSNGSAQDIELDSLCASSTPVTLQVRFGTGRIEDLPVKLAP